MRARPSRIMAEIRSEYGLTVRQAWAVYRDFRDQLPGKPSLANLERHRVSVQGLVLDRFGEPYPDIDYDSEWEVTVEYEG